MALSPQEIRDATFKSVKRGGLDPDEVSEFKLAAADALQQAIQDATAMEARARAAVARLQELSQQQAAAAETTAVAETPAEPEPPARREPTVDEAETISRTLLLAQRTADSTVADAQAEAERIMSSARDEAASIIEAAKAESRKAGEAERVRVEGEVQALLARRDFLESDVDQLEQHLGAQRDRIAEVVAQLEELTNRTTNGLAPMRRPQLSASDQGSFTSEPALVAGADVDDDDEPDVAALIDEVVETADSGGEELGEIARVAGAEGDVPVSPDDDRHSLFDDES